MPVKPRIGVVTVTYNSGSVLEPFLKCVFEQTDADLMLFAVDNASTDTTLQILNQSDDTRLISIANSKNRGVAEGNNQGIRAALDAGCESVLLVNNDTEFDATLFSSLVAGLQRYDVGMICPKMMFYDEPQRIWAAGGKFQPLFGYRAVHLGADQIDTGQHDQAKLVTYAPTCCVLIQKQVFDQIGFMDERYFVYSDDVDFMYRAMRHGIKLMYFPEALLYHKVGRLTGGCNSLFSHRYCTRNRVFFMLLHLGVFASVPALIFYEMYFVAGFLSRKFGLTALRVKQNALFEGVGMWRSSPRPR